MSWNQPSGANCASCPLAINDHPPHRPVCGEGPANAVGILLGEGPGHDEVEIGRPFVGPTGNELNQELTEAGLMRGRLFLSNALCCRAPPDKTEGMVSAAVVACSGRLKLELDAHPNKPVFAMGKLAWKSILDGKQIPKGGLFKGRGFLRKTADGRDYIATWHPTFAFFRNPYEWGAFGADIRRFKRLLSGALKPLPSALIVEPTLGQVVELLSTRELGPLAVDIECAPEEPDKPWTGKDPKRARLRTLGVGNCDRGFSLRCDGSAGDIASDERIQAIKQFLATQHTIWQNGPGYDHGVLRRYGFHIANWDDTRDARKALVTTSPLSLAYMASLYDDCIPWKQEDEDDDKGLVFTDDWDRLMVYNAQDAVETARVWRGITSEPEWATGRVQELYRIHKSMAVQSARMRWWGFKLHAENRRNLSESLAVEHKLRMGALVAYVGHPEFTGTADNLRSLIFKRHAEPDLREFDLPDPIDENMWTDGGDISVDQASLLLLAANPACPPRLRRIIDLYWEANAVWKIKSTFVDSALIDQALRDDGRVGSSWNSCGADTGRWSCKAPNLMTVNEGRG